MRPDIDHVDRAWLVMQRRVEQRLRDFHRIGASQQRQSADPFRRAPRGFQRDQRTHAVTDQQRVRDAGCIEYRQQPVGHRFHRYQRRTLAAAVARQVDR